MKRFVEWMLRFLIGSDRKTGDLPLTYSAFDTVEAHVYPGDSLGIVIHLGRWRIVEAQIPVDREWNGKFWIEYQSDQDGSQRLAVTFPDYSSKEYAPPPAGVKWVPR